MNPARVCPTYAKSRLQNYERLPPRTRRPQRKYAFLRSPRAPRLILKRAFRALSRRRTLLDGRRSGTVVLLVGVLPCGLPPRARLRSPRPSEIASGRARGAISKQKCVGTLLL